MGSQVCSCAVDVGAAAQAVSSRDDAPTSCPSSYRKGADAFRSWRFSPITLEFHELEQVAMSILWQHIEELEIEEERMSNFVSKVLSGYLPNPYHNRSHAVDVTQAIFRFGELMAWERIFDEKSRFALSVAALAHDLGHPGVTNAFIVDVRDALALRYNDVSPLENLHCSKLFELLQQHAYNVFANLSLLDFRDVRKLVIDVILHTDMAHHGAMVKELQALLDSHPKVFYQSERITEPSGDLVELLKTGNNKKLLSRLLLHGADLLNPARPWEIAHAWAHQLVEEFFHQGDKERSLGLPVGFLNDREKLNIPDSQIGFVKFVYAPFLATQVRVLPCLAELAENLSFNVKQWEQLLAKSKSKDGAGPPPPDERVKSICGLLEPSQAEPEPEEILPCRSRPSTCSRSAPRAMACTMTDGFGEEAFGLATTLRQQTFVREVRRWQERPSVCGGPGGRQLVLFYVMPSPMDAGGGSAEATHRTQSPAILPSSAGEDLAVAVYSSDGEDPVAAQVSCDKAQILNGHGLRAGGVCQAQASCNKPMVPLRAADSVHHEVDGKDFDELLAVLLEPSCSRTRPRV